MSEVAGLTTAFLACLGLVVAAILGVTWLLDFVARNLLPRRARRWYRMRMGVCGACDVSGRPPDCDDDDMAVGLGLTDCRRYQARTMT